jgi:tetratricopeptide (TPR) repeat protein
VSPPSAETRDLDAALAALSSATGQPLAERDYRSLLNRLERVVVDRGDARAALTVIAHAASYDDAAWARAARLLDRVPPIDRALAAAAQGQFAEAAREMDVAGRTAAAAIYWERANDWAAARTAWSRLARASPGSDAYVVALVFFHLARCARRYNDPAQARECFGACVERLEHAADHFESIGLRERAFDCFQVLIQVGRESGAFEDILEGYVNATRILREDQLRQFAMDTFDASIEAAAGRSEFNAAATLAREAAEYARSLRAGPAARGYALRQAELWRAAAKQQKLRGAPPEMIANALLSAILAFGEVDQLGRCGQIYAELAALDIDPRRREHYARTARRYAAAGDQPLAVSGPRSDASRRTRNPGQVGHADILEWEQRGSASEACASLMLDTESLDATRRKAMLVRLAALDVEARADDDTVVTALRVSLVHQLGNLGQYGVLSALETMFARGDRSVKLAVLEALRTLLFKRSFVTVRRALADPDPSIGEQAARTIEALHFPHAFDPLVRIFRESAVPVVRAGVLRALVRTDTSESADFVSGVIEHGPPVDRAAAIAALLGAPPGRALEVAREAMVRAPALLREALRDLLPANEPVA